MRRTSKRNLSKKNLTNDAVQITVPEMNGERDNIVEKIINKTNIIEDNIKEKPNVIEERIKKKSNITEESTKKKSNITKESIKKKSNIIEESIKKKSNIIEESINESDIIKESINELNIIEESINETNTIKEVIVNKSSLQPFRLKIQIEKLPLKPNLIIREKSPVTKSNKAKKRKTQKNAEKFLTTNNNTNENGNEFNYTCLVCKQDFSVLSEFYDHSKEHFTCNICEMEFMSQKSHSKHYKTHRSQNDKLPFQCHVCSTLFKTMDEIKKHDHIFLDKYLNALDNGIEYCESCNIPFNDEITLRKHLDSHVEKVSPLQLNNSVANKEECAADQN